MSFKAYTDYPIEDGTYDAGVKEIQVLSYDGDKYCTVLRNGFEDEVKTGYIFLDPQLKRRPNPKMFHALPDTPEGEPLTRRQVAAKAKRLRRKETAYTIDVKKKGFSATVKIRRLKTLKDALTCFATEAKNKEHSVYLYRSRYHKHTTEFGPLLWIERPDDFPTIACNRRHRRANVSVWTLQKHGVIRS